MALFFRENDHAANGMRKTGFARYRELLERDFIHFVIIHFLTLISLIPAILGIGYAMLNSSLLYLIPAGLLGGAIAGPFISGLLDCIFRSLRDASSHYLKNYWKAIKQNARDSIFLGAVSFLFLGLYCFMGLIWWKVGFPSFLNIALALLCLAIFIMFLTLYWIQLILFQQTIRQRFLNCILFAMTYFWKTLGATAMQMIYWALFVLLMPYTLFLLPILGLWFILFLVSFSLYKQINEAFSLEEKISEAFPEQTPYYESDAEWLERKSQQDML